MKNTTDNNLLGSYNAPVTGQTCFVEEYLVVKSTKLNPMGNISKMKTQEIQSYEMNHRIEDKAKEPDVRETGTNEAPVLWKFLSSR